MKEEKKASNKRALGSEKERLAAAYLEAHGMRILEHNYRTRHGEIDLIGRHKGYLVFVEVKYRRGDTAGNALDAVDYRKQCQICRTADTYRAVHRISADCGIRYDVLAIQGERITWIPNAFDHIYTRAR